MFNQCLHKGLEHLHETQKVLKYQFAVDISLILGEFEQRILEIVATMAKVDLE